VCSDKEIRKNCCPRRAFLPVLPENAPRQVRRLFTQRAVRRSRSRNAIRQALSDGKNDRVSANTTEETSREAASAAVCRQSSQRSPFASPLKIASRTEVSTATALTGSSLSAVLWAIQPVRAILAGGKVHLCPRFDTEPVAQLLRNGHLAFRRDKRFHGRNVRIECRSIKYYLPKQSTHDQSQLFSVSAFSLSASANGAASATALGNAQGTKCQTQKER
jgi:hypothetical protein